MKFKIKLIEARESDESLIEDEISERSSSKVRFTDSIWWEYIQIFVIAFAIVFLFIKPFIVEAYRIPSSSMEDTLLVGDRILVAKFYYGIRIPFTNKRIFDFNKPKVGDVFVFDPPPRAGEKQSFIKRVVGVPGDTIEIRNGNLYRNGVLVRDEGYVKRCPGSPQSPQFMPKVAVPEGCFFALGDNRDKSSDSRSWGFVPIENVKGRAFMIYWSWDKDADLWHKIRFNRIGRIIR